MFSEMINITENYFNELSFLVGLFILWLVFWVINKKPKAYLSLALLLTIIRRFFIFIPIPGTISNYNNIVFFDSYAYVLCLIAIAGLIIYLGSAQISFQDEKDFKYEALIGLSRFVFGVNSILLGIALFDANSRSILLISLFAALKLLLISPILPFVIVLLIVLSFWKMRPVRIKYLLILTAASGIYQTGYQGFNLYLSKDPSVKKNMEIITSLPAPKTYDYQTLDFSEYLVNWLENAGKIEDQGINILEKEALKTRFLSVTNTIDDLSGIRNLFKVIINGAFVFYTILFLLLVVLVSTLIRKTNILTRWYMLRRCGISDDAEIRSMLFLKLEYLLTDGESYLLSKSKFNDIKEKAVSSDNISERQRFRFCNNKSEFVRKVACRKIELKQISRYFSVKIAQSGYPDIRNFIIGARSLPYDDLIDLCFDKNKSVRNNALVVALTKQFVTEKLQKRFVKSKYDDVRDNALNANVLNKQYLTILCNDKVESIRKKAFDQLVLKKNISRELIVLSKSSFRDVKLRVIKSEKLSRERLLQICKKVRDVEISGTAFTILKNVSREEYLFLRESKNIDIRVDVVKSGYLSKPQLFLLLIFGSKKIKPAAKEMIRNSRKTTAESIISNSMKKQNNI